jgi:hypothetical protein
MALSQQQFEEVANRLPIGRDAASVLVSRMRALLA